VRAGTSRDAKIADPSEGASKTGFRADREAGFAERREHFFVQSGATPKEAGEGMRWIHCFGNSSGMALGFT